jgi:hypothetical protein
MKVTVNKETITFKGFNYKEFMHLKQVINTQEVFVELPKNLEGNNVHIVNPRITEVENA